MDNERITEADIIEEPDRPKDLVIVKSATLRPVQEEQSYVQQDQALASTAYAGASTIEFSDQQIARLIKYRKVPHDWISIKPDDGLIYMDHMKYREVLNEAFGPGLWSLVPVGDFKVEEKGNVVTLYRTYRFYVMGKFVREAVGAGQYFKSNSKMNFADAAETCESDVLKRMLKPFGIAGQCWDRRYQEWFKQTYCKKSGASWVRVKWDEPGWWDGKTTELGILEEDQPVDEETGEVKRTSSPRPDRRIATGLIRDVKTVSFKGKVYYYLIIDGVEYWTESETIRIAARRIKEEGRPVSLEYDTTTRKPVITAFDLTDA